MELEVTRMVVVRCVDWPVLAESIALNDPAAVIVDNHILACSPAARKAGVQVGHRKREAQQRCPEVRLVPFDSQQCSLMFEPVLSALEEITPRVEMYEAGLVGFPTRGPSKFYGGDQQLAELVKEQVGEVLAGISEEYRLSVQVGVADGVFAAQLASTTNPAGPVHVITQGASARFLAPEPVTRIENQPLADLLVRLGLTTLGKWAEIPEGDVTGRFGNEGVKAHRLANGLDEYPPKLRRPAPELSASTRFEPPAESVPQCEYVAASLAARLLASMRSEGLSCTRLGIEAETENGETLTRWWRYHGADLSADLIAERVRQQLDGWLQQDQTVRPRSGILRISLIPDEVVPVEGDQMTIWDTDVGHIEEVGRLISRLQTMVGLSTVWVPERAGGIGPNEQIKLVPADSISLEREAYSFQLSPEPWPGHVPAPAPAQVFVTPDRVKLLDRQGIQVAVNGRGEIWNDPTVLVLGEDHFDIESWAGPWLDDRWWWDSARHRRRARMQILTSSTQAFLLMSEGQQWWLEAAYD